MAALRMKFVAQAQKYIGVPYARKYWPPECECYTDQIFMSPTQGEGDILFLVRILLASGLALASA